MIKAFCVFSFAKFLFRCRIVSCVDVVGGRLVGLKMNCDICDAYSFDEYSFIFLMSRRNVASSISISELAGIEMCSGLRKVAFGWECSNCRFLVRFNLMHLLNLLSFWAIMNRTRADLIELHLCTK